MSEENTYYVFNIGGNNPAKRYHRGTCRWVKFGKSLHHEFLVFTQKTDAKYYREDGHLQEREPCDECIPITSESKGGTSYHIPSNEPRPRIPDGSLYFASFNGVCFHYCPDCDILIQETKGGNVYGFVTEDDAVNLDTDRKTRLDQSRLECTLCKAFKVKPGTKPKPQSSAIWDAKLVWRYSTYTGKDTIELKTNNIKLGAGKGASDKITLTAMPPAGSQSLSVEIWGNDDLQCSAEINCELSCDKTAICGQPFSAQVEIVCKPKEIWQPQKLFDHLASAGKERIAVPPDLYCTPNIAWKGLLIGIRSLPELETLENLKLVAQKLEDYRKTLFDNKSIMVVNGWRTLDKVTLKTSSETKLRAQGLAVDFKVKGIAAPEVQDMLMPYHGGGLGIPHGQTYIDLRPYVARLDRDMHIDLMYPPDCRVIPTLTDKDIEEAFGKVLKTRKLPKAALPPGCTCATKEGDVAKGELPQCIRVKDCACLRNLPEPLTKALILLQDSATIEVSEDVNRTVTKSFLTHIYASIMLIQDAYGEGATNLKYYAFYGGFISRAKISDIDLVKKLGEAGFCENWLVRIPVKVDLKGDFEIISLPSEDFTGDFATQNRVVLKAIGHNSPCIEKISFSGIPKTIGPANGTFSYNTAGDGEAHGESCKTNYSFIGTDISYAGISDPKTFAGLGSLVVSYNYRFGSNKDAVSAISFGLSFVEG